MLFTDVGGSGKPVECPFFIQSFFDNSPDLQQTFIAAKRLGERKYVTMNQLSPLSHHMG